MYSRGEYCQTCHYRYQTDIEKHARHKKDSVTCDDCHPATLAPDGKRYSVHDHLFDFSQPEIPCAECHDAGDERLGRTPAHKWNFRPVLTTGAPTIEQNCARCHQGKEQSWIQEQLKKLRRRL